VRRRAHLAEDVGGARRHVGLEDRRERLELGSELVEGTLGDLEGDEGGDVLAGRLEVDVRPVAGDHTSGLEPLEPGLDGGPGDLREPRQLQHAGPRVLAERGEQGEVQSVEVHGQAV
jgi:hypothetical protein